MCRFSLTTPSPGTLPDLPQCRRIFSLLRATSAALATRAFARTADAAAVSCNAPASACARSDTACVVDDTVSELAGAAVRYGEVNSAAVFASVGHQDRDHRFQ